MTRAARTSPDRPLGSRRAVMAAAAGLATVATLTLTGCSSDGGTDPAPTSTAATAAQRLADAKARVDQAKTVHLAITSSDVPRGASGVISADGWGGHPPAFKGTFKVQVRGISADASVTATEGEVWAKMPLAPGTHKIDPVAFGMPDPAVLLSPDRGLTTLLTDTASPAFGPETRRGSEVLTTVTGTVPGRRIVELLVIGDANASYDATYGLTEDDELREVRLIGPFFGSDTRSTYTVTFDQYDTPQTFEKPA